MTLPAKVTLIPKAFSAIAAAVNGLLSWAEPWDKMKVGTGLKLTRAPGGHLLSVDTSQMAQVMAGSGALPGSRSLPFAVRLSNPATPAATIAAESYLYDSLSAALPRNIGSLTTPITLTSSTKIWLRVTFISAAVNGATITTTNPTNIVTSSDFHVLIGRVVLASSVDASTPGFAFSISGTDYYFEQTLFTHLRASVFCNSGTAAMYADAFSAR